MGLTLESDVYDVRRRNNALRRKYRGAYWPIFWHEAPMEVEQTFGTLHIPEEASISVTDLFSIGIGPSSSHTVGPMRASAIFASTVASLTRIDKIEVDLFGSLALTGKGHGTVTAVMLGLAGWRPDRVDPEDVPYILDEMRASKRITVGANRISFDEANHIKLHRGTYLQRHPNSLRITAYFEGEIVHQNTFYSIGGGTVIREGDTNSAKGAVELHFPFKSAAELLAIGSSENLLIAEIMLANESAWREEAEALATLDEIRSAMMDSIERGCRHGGILPGGLKVKRRAPILYKNLNESGKNSDPL